MGTEVQEVKKTDLGVYLLQMTEKRLSGWRKTGAEWQSPKEAAFSDEFQGRDMLSIDLQSQGKELLVQEYK